MGRDSVAGGDVFPVQAIEGTALSAEFLQRIGLLQRPDLATIQSDHSSINMKLYQTALVTLFLLSLSFLDQNLFIRLSWKPSWFENIMRMESHNNRLK